MPLLFNGDLLTHLSLPDVPKAGEIAVRSWRSSSQERNTSSRAFRLESICGPQLEIQFCGVEFSKMRKSGWTPSIVPLVDLVLDDFGGRIGSAWREANFEAKF